MVHRDKTIVLVGPLNSDDFIAHGLHHLPNIIFTGGKDINELPQYLQYFDCAIIPFYCNKLTASIYPLKINEYLAAGRPVVTTDFSKDIRDFQNVVYLAEDEADFLDMIDRAIVENCVEKIMERVRVAEQNTWSVRVQQFWKAIEQVESGATEWKEELLFIYRGLGLSFQLTKS